MKNMMKVTFFTIIILISVTSCTPSYIGQRVQGLNTSSIEQSGHVYDDSRDVIFDYDVSIDHENNKININGTVMIKGSAFSGAWDADTIDLYFYLLDNQNRIFKKEHTFVRVNGEFADAKFNFSATFDYNAGYVRIANGYRVRVSL